MFTERTLSSSLESVRAEYAAGTLVLDCGSDFETLPAAQAEELSLVTDRLDPLSYPEAWLDAGDRIEDRLGALPGAIARGETSFTDGAELACSAIKHAGEIPRPFDAFDAEVYLDHGPDFAVEWADRTVDALE